MSKAKIMIIEDEYIVAMDIQMILENQGYEVTAIEFAAETALEKAEKTRPDLALVDIALEGRMDGIQAAEQLRSRFNIPVVYLTAFADEIKLERAKKTEPFGYLIKPFKEEDLKSAIEIALFKNDMEMKLRHSEERYRTLIESTEDAVYLIDREMRFLYANRRYLTRHGLSLKDIEGLEYEKCHSASRTKEFSQKVEQVFESNKSVVYEHESEKDKKIFLRTLSPVKDPRTGEINSIIVISKDITERKQAEEKLLRQNAIIKAINRVFYETLTCETEEDLARTCLAVALELTGSKIGFLGKLKEAGLVDTIALNNPAWEACLIPKSKAPVLLKNMEVRGIWGRVIKDGKTVLTNDPPSHPDSVGFPEGHPPLTSFLGVPLKEGGKTFGMIALANKEYGFNSADQEAMENLSVALAEVLQRKKIEEVLREYKKAVESSKEMIASVDRNYVYLFVNEAFLSYHKLNWAQVVGRKIEDVLGKEVFETTIKKPLDRCLQGEIVQYEMSRQYPEIGERILEVSYHPLIGKDKKIEGAVALISDITERKRAEEALRMEKNRAQNYLDVAEVMIVAINKEGNVTLINKKGCEILGYDEGEILGKNWFENFLPERIREELLPVSKKLMAGEVDPVKYYENPVLTKKGEEKIIAWHNTVIKDEHRNIVAHLSSGEDITARKQAEEALKESENKYRELYDEAPIGYHEIDREGRLTRVNKTEAELLGYALEEMIGRYVWEFMALDQRELSRKAIKKKIEQKKTGESFERKYICKNGKEIDIYITDRLILDKSGNLIGIRSTLENITEHKQAEEALRESEERFRQLSEASFEGITIHDQGILLRANDQFFKMFGYEPDELLGKQTINKLIATESRNLMWDQIRKGSADIYEAIGVRKDGTEFSLELRPRQIEYKGRNVRVVAIRDITERKLAEMALRESEEKFRVLSDSTFEGILIHEKGKVLDTNSTFSKIFGYKQSELIGMDALKLIAPESQELVRNNITIDFEKSYETVGLRKDGTTFIMEINARMFLYKNRRVRIAVCRDITERKKAEEALRESEEKFRGLADSIKDVFFAMDCNLKYTYWNKASEELTGIPVQEALGKSIYEIFPEIRGTSLEKFYLEVFEKQEFHSMENLFPIGSRNYVFQINAYPTINGLTVIAKDITARKQTEEALLKERNFVSAVLDTAPAIVVVLNAQGRIVRFNLAAEHLTGYKFSEVEGKYYWDLFLPPEEAGKAKDAFFYLEAGKFPYKSEEYWLTKDSERRLIAWSNSFILDDQGWVEYYISTGIDITERKKVEQKLLKSQKELRSLSKYLQDVREGERKRISREIHDELGQTLTALKIDLAMLAESIPEKQKKLLDQTKSISELIDIILTTVKRISSDLRPGLLDDFGLVPAIEWQAAEFTKRTGTKCLLSLPDEEIKIDQEHSTAIFRILQEALTNVTRHARATEVRISVSKTDREIRLTVKDNGIGIKEKDISSSSSLGLIGIRERAQFFKGKVNIRSERDKGTTLKVSIPYPKEGSR